MPALWNWADRDLCKNEYGNDNELSRDALNAAALQEKMLRYQPRFLAFTSKTSASAMLQIPTGKIPYGLHPHRIANTQLFVLPSPSGQGRKYWDIGPWQTLADLVLLQRPE